MLVTVNQRYSTGTTTVKVEMTEAANGTTMAGQFPLDDMDAEHGNMIWEPEGGTEKRGKVIDFNAVDFVESLITPKTKAQASESKEPSARSILEAEFNSKEQPERSSVESELNSTLEESCTTTEVLRRSQKETKDLKQEVFQLRKELTEAHDFIFSLQPRQHQVTETEVAADFLSLCQGVEEWVETKLGDHIHEGSLTKGFDYSHAKKFLNHVSPPGHEAFAIPDTDEYNISGAIMKFLCTEILCKDFYVDIERGAMNYLNGLMTSMGNLEPRRDLSACRRWRSELFAAVANRHEFKTQRETKADETVTDLTNMLLIFLPSLPIREQVKIYSSIRNIIVEPALCLAHKLHLSVDRFSLVWTDYSNTRPEFRKSTPALFKDFECMDLVKSKKLKPQDLEAAGTITYIVDLSPELRLEAVKADVYAEPKVLCKARVLVAATKKGKGSFMGPDLESGEVVTLMGWLADRLRRKGRWG